MTDESKAIPASGKPALREWALARRSDLDMPRLSERLREAVRGLPEFKAATHILIYSAMPGEVCLTELAEETQATEKHWYLPRCAPKRRLAIHPYTPHTSRRTPLRAGPFGIFEPDPDLVPEAEPTVLDLVIVPALLLTPTGGRLGYGGGYYDRFLPHLRPDCRIVGALPAALIVDSLPQDPWDRSVHRVIGADVS